MVVSMVVSGMNEWLHPGNRWLQILGIGIQSSPPLLLLELEWELGLWEEVIRK